MGSSQDRSCRQTIGSAATTISTSHRGPGLFVRSTSDVRRHSFVSRPAFSPPLPTAAPIAGEKAKLTNAIPWPGQANEFDPRQSPPKLRWRRSLRPKCVTACHYATVLLWLKLQSGNEQLNVEELKIVKTAVEGLFRCLRKLVS